MTTISTPVSMITFMVLNPIASLSPDMNALGAIMTEVIQMPKAQIMEISWEDFLWMIRMIRGMSHKGRMTAAQKPIVFTK